LRSEVSRPGSICNLHSTEFEILLLSLSLSFLVD
jgi:hypothetical protein